MRYFVTGGTGFIGSAVVRRLVADGHEVVVLDNNLRGKPRRIVDLLDRVRMVEADVRDTDKVASAMVGCDVVIHLASVNGTKNFYERPELVIDVGVRGILSVIDACRATGVRRLIVASSSEVYQTPPMVPTPESVPLVIPDPLNPRFSYAAQKLVSEVVVLNYSLTNFEQAVVFRPHNVYGPDMGWGHVIPDLVLKMTRAIANEGALVPIEIQGDGSQTRAFCFIDDFVDGLITVLERGEHRHIYHIGTQEELSIAELARAVSLQLGIRIRLLKGDLPLGSTERRCPDVSKLRALGYQPKVSLTSGLKQTVGWYADHIDEAPGPGAIV
jgi:dTDP-glucose 4,6-dehydratase/UDP-glucose 4-epimerase